MIVEAFAQDESHSLPELARSIFGDSTQPVMRKLKLQIRHLESMRVLHRTGAASYKAGTATLDVTEAEPAQDPQPIVAPAPSFPEIVSERKPVKVQRVTKRSGETYYARKRAAGLCGICKQPAMPGLSTCEDHRQSHDPDRYERLLRTGKCTKCHTRPLLAGKSCCEVCLDRKCDQQQRRKERAHEAGLCVGCGTKPSEAGTRRCADCKRKRSAKTRQYALEQRLLTSAIAWGGQTDDDFEERIGDLQQKCTALVKHDPDRCAEICLIAGALQWAALMSAEDTSDEHFDVIADWCQRLEELVDEVKQRREARP